MVSSGELFMPSREGYFVVNPNILLNISNQIHQNNIRVRAWIVHHESTYIILFPTRHNESINEGKKGDLHTSTAYLTCSVYILLMTSQSIADYVTMAKHLWRDHSNSDVRYQFY